jgi:hypothetical protein
MKPLKILNDAHIGVKRAAGTTPASALSLRMYLTEAFQRLLPDPGTDLLILGDLFDAFAVDNIDFWEIYSPLMRWLEHGDSLILVQGNHDMGHRPGACSSFKLLARMLQHAYSLQVRDLTCGLSEVMEGIFVIPHLPNQEIFDKELERAIRNAECGIRNPGTEYLLTHCNMMPPECQTRSDQSLSIGKEMAERLAKHYVLINAHEHQHRFYDVGRGIHCLGNQFPSSIADCLSDDHRQKDGVKYSHTIEADRSLSKSVTWDATGSFSQVDWDDPQAIPSTLEFIRVGGEATAAEAPQVLDQIFQLRKEHRAYVIANAVRIEGWEWAEDAALNVLGNMESFDPLNALLAELDPAERKVIEEVMTDD